METLRPRVVAEVNLDAIKHNYKQIRNHVPHEVEIMAIVKADAYGHGAVEVSKLLQEEGVNRFAVAIAKEGEELRSQGITSPILILGYTPRADIKTLIENNLEPKETIVEISARLISNKSSYKFKNEKISNLREEIAKNL